MDFPLPVPFVPSAASDAVKKLLQRLGVENAPVYLPVAVEPGAKVNDCYFNVQKRIERDGGRMRLGWAVWQHANLFIEAERHAVYEPGDGKEPVDCTPHVFPDGSGCSKILFVSNDGDAYDFNEDALVDNIRVPLSDDPRISQALGLFSQKTALMNSVPGVDIELPPDVSREIAELDLRAWMLMLSAIPSNTRRAQRVGRNEACPCGSGTKYKRCHGR